MFHVEPLRRIRAVNLRMLAAGNVEFRTQPLRGWPQELRERARCDRPSAGRTRGRRHKRREHQTPVKPGWRRLTSTRSASSVLPARLSPGVATEAARRQVLPFDVPARDKSEANEPLCLWKTSTHYWRSRFPARVITCVCDRVRPKDCAETGQRLQRGQDA